MEYFFSSFLFFIPVEIKTNQMKKAKSIYSEFARAIESAMPLAF